MNFGYENIRNIFTRKGYRFFDNDKPFNVNIFGIRMKVDTDRFDDYIGVAFCDGDLKEVVYVWPATTDPGRYWLNHPMNKKGTFIMVPDQYRGLWAVGKHQGKYTALVQVGIVKGFRDNDKDSNHDLDPSTIDEGANFGVNCHHSSYTSESTIVNKWSAGCQVLKRIGDFNELMNLIIKSAVIYKSNFTYTLLEESDFE